MSDAPFNPSFSTNSTFGDKWNDRPIRRYYKGLNQQLTRDPAEQAYRVRAYQDLGNQTMAAQDQARFSGNQAFGFNNPSGIPSALMMRASMSAPYGEADMAAEEAGRKSFQNTGQALMNEKMQQADWYTRLKGLNLQYQNMKSQQQIAEAQAAAAASV